MNTFSYLAAAERFDMLNQPIPTQMINAQLVSEFLNLAFSKHAGSLEHRVDKEIRCWGFPEFNPLNRNEYLGFFNYLHDAFGEVQFTVERCLADRNRVAIRFIICGVHQEEFMGLPATGGKLKLQATALFRVEGGVIREVWMYGKNVILTTKKDIVFQLVNKTKVGN